MTYLQLVYIQLPCFIAICGFLWSFLCGPDVTKVKINKQATAKTVNAFAHEFCIWTENQFMQLRNLTLIHNLQFPLRKPPVPLSKIQWVQSSKGCILYWAVFQIIFHMTKIRSQIILLLLINRFEQTVAMLITAGGAVPAPCRGNEGRRWWQR